MTAKTSTNDWALRSLNNIMSRSKINAVGERKNAVLIEKFNAIVESYKYNDWGGALPQHLDELKRINNIFGNIKTDAALQCLTANSTGISLAWIRRKVTEIKKQFA